MAVTSSLTWMAARPSRVERMLAILLRLKDLRQGKIAG